MSNEAENKKEIFKYNMSFYYQSTIIYFVAFLLYALIRGEFVEDSFTLITRDPIIYFFAIIVLVSLAALLFNVYKNKYLAFDDKSLVFVNRFRTKEFRLENIVRIRISSSKDKEKNGAFRIVRIKLNNRKRPLVIRPYDYENGKDLLKKFQDIKSKIENH